MGLFLYCASLSQMQVKVFDERIKIKKGTVWRWMNRWVYYQPLNYYAEVSRIIFNIVDDVSEIHKVIVAPHVFAMLVLEGHIHPIGVYMINDGYDAICYDRLVIGTCKVRLLSVTDASFAKHFEGNFTTVVPIGKHGNRLKS